MKRLALAVSAAAFLLAAVVLSSRADRTESASRPDLAAIQAKVEPVNPWTNLRLNNDKEEFQFAIVTDRTGGVRPGVFEKAVETLNLLQPEFVISVGDLISGQSTKQGTEKQWTEFNGFVQQLEMPFFYVPGNHDIGTKVGNDAWGVKYGRRYYHFVYRNVLFLMLNSEEIAKGAPGFIGKEQLDYAAEALKANAQVRWTIVSVHKPLWTYKEIDLTNWLEVEKLLAGRPHTVFAGHKHRYEKFQRNCGNYYMLATTGGSSRLRGIPFGEFDHLIWVTMKKSGPRLANVMLDGIYPENIDTTVGAPPVAKAPEN